MLELIAAGGNDVKALAEQFGISPSTVRRDLQRLSSEKAIMRTYGGAMLVPPVVEENYFVRENVHRAAKEAIAKAAAEQIEDGETILLDGGSTVTFLGQFLWGRKLSIVTNNIKLASFLAEAPDISLILLGGSLRPISMSTYGPLAEETLRYLTVAKLFTSANGLTAQRGLCEATLEQISLKRLMMRQARETFVLVDASKLGCADQPAWAELHKPWTLITDAQEERWSPFAQEGARVIQVESDV